jgi:hypothetical protein
MLNDKQINSLNKNKEYEKTLKSGIKSFIKDLVNLGHSDLKPNIIGVIKFDYSIAKFWLIKTELTFCTKTLLERILNYELIWDKKPESIYQICNSENNYIWMRYDEQRVNALFNRSKFLLNNSNYRDLIKTESTVNSDKNNKIKEVLYQLQSLHKQTISAIRRRGIFNDIISTRADEFYDEHGEKMISNILNGTIDTSNTNLLSAPKQEENGES